MSLIADSLKRALKESPGVLPQAPQINLLKKRKSKRSVSEAPPFIRVFFLIILPASVLGYLVWAGAFDERKTKLVDLPILKTLGIVSEKPGVAKAPVAPPAKIPARVPVAPPKEQVKKVVPPALMPARSPSSAEKKSLIPEPKKFTAPNESRPLKEIVEDFREKYTKEIAGKPPEAKKQFVSEKSVVKKPGVIEKPVAIEEALALEAMEKSNVLEAEEIVEVPPPPVRKLPRIVEDRRPPPLSFEKPEELRREDSAPIQKPKAELYFAETPDPEIFKDGNYYFNTAVFYQQSRDWEKALSNYAKADKMDPGNVDIYNNRGLIYKELKQYDKAVEEFMKTVFLDPNYAKAYNNIGVVYYVQKNYSGAIQNYRKAIDINRNNLEALNNLAIAYQALNQVDKAKAVLKQALSLDPEHPGTNYNMAVMFEAKGNVRAALYHYRRFIELGKNTHPTLAFEVQKHIQKLVR